MGAGNLELVKLLVKRKADVASKNKNGKTAADLARDLAVKEVLNEAVLAAIRSQEDAVRSDVNSTEPSGLTDTVDVQKISNTSAERDVEIGPQERPPDIMQDDGATSVPSDVSKHLTAAAEQVSANRSIKSERQVQSQTSDPESYRPSKMQKVALSFAEDDDTD